MTKKSRNRNQINRQDNSKKWLTIITILGGCITIILGLLGLFPGLRTHLGAYKEFSNPSQLVVIQSSIIYQSVAKLITEDDPSRLSFEEISMRRPPVECLNYQYPECEVILFLGEWVSPGDYSINLVLSSAATSPIIIHGPSITLVGYRPLSDNVQDIFLNLALGSGGATVYRAFTLSEFPLNGEQGSYSSLPFKVDDPAKSIGISQVAAINCEDASPCEEVIFLEDASDVEGIELTMPFLDTLPPGWYSFELDIAFSYNGEQYHSDDTIKFDVIKPSSVHAWYGFDGSQPLRPEFLQYSVSTGMYEYPTTSPEPTNDPGKLVYQYDYTNLILDLQTNELTAFPVTGFYSHKEQFMVDLPAQTQISPEGTRLVSAVFQDKGSNLELIDIRSLETTRLTSSNDIREIYPAWSPLGHQILYLGLALSDTPILKKGEADLFIYDLETKIIQRITYTPSVIEIYPTWINENEISFLFDSSNNSQSGMDYGLSKVNVSTGDVWVVDQSIVSSPFINDMDYYSMNDILTISFFGDDFKAFDLEGNLRVKSQEPGETSSRCTLLDSIPLKQLCVGPEGAYLTNTLGDEVVWLIRYSSNLPTWPIVVQVPTGGFAILDVNNSSLIQYDDRGTEINRWSMSEFKKVGGLSGIYRPFLISGPID